MAVSHHYIITYDVYSDARRKALHWRLRKWAQPIQRSVMEAALTKKELGQLIAATTSVITKKDTVKIFRQQRPGPIVVLGAAKRLKMPKLKKAKKAAANPRRNTRTATRRNPTYRVHVTWWDGAREVFKTGSESTARQWASRLKKRSDVKHAEVRAYKRNPTRANRRSY